MRILLCNNNYNFVGGVEVFFHEVARVLKDNGHTVEYFTLYSEKCDSEYSSLFPCKIDFSNILTTAIKLPKLIYSFEAKKSISKVLSHFNPDIVHCFNIYTGLTPSILDAIRKFNIPCVISFNDYKHICPNYKLFHHGKICEACRGNCFIQCFLNKCCHNSYIWSFASTIEAYVHSFLNIYKKNVNMITFASRFMLNKTTEFKWLENLQTAIIINPFHSKKFIPNYCDKGYILFFGRIIEEKGVDFLIDVMQLNPSIQLKIVGDGPQFQVLNKKINDNNIHNITFLGPKWGDEMNDLISNARFTVVPSLWYENVGYVIIQSFAYGKPVIISNRGGMPEFVEDSVTGFVLDLDIEQFSKTISMLWNDKDLCVRLGKNAKKYVDNTFNDSVFYNQLMSAYSKIIK